MHLSESHFKLLVRVGVCAGTAVDTDKWWRQWALLCCWETHISRVGLGICLPPGTRLIYMRLTAIKVTPRPGIRNLYTLPFLCDKNCEHCYPWAPSGQNKLLQRNQTNSCFRCWLWKHIVSSLECIKRRAEESAAAQRLIVSLQHKCLCKNNEYFCSSSKMCINIIRNISIQRKV